MVRVPQRAGSLPRGGPTPSIRDFCAGLPPSARRAKLAAVLTGERAPDGLVLVDEIERIKSAKKRLKASPAPAGKSKLHGNITKEIERLLLESRRLAGDVPSSPWYDAADVHGEEFPPGRSERRTPHGSRMIVSTISGRYTPPQNLSDEDRLDRMTVNEADAYAGPSSCGSVVTWKNV